MNRIVSKYWQPIILTILSAMVFCYWLFLYPYIPVAREMSQLFLWTGDYFTERIMIPGGLAQYLGEMISQFFINTINGAIANTIILIVAQQLSNQWLCRLFPSLKAAYKFVLSLLVPAVLWRLAMIPQIPLTMTVAVILVMGAGCLVMMISQKPPVRKRLWVLMLTIPVMYWLAGPAAVLLCFCSLPLVTCLLPLALFTACLIGSSYLTPYPLRQVAVGIDYFAADNRVGMQVSTYEEMECDMLFRQGKWQQMIHRFQNPESPAVRSAVLFAYFKAGVITRGELMNNLVHDSQSVFSTNDVHFIVNFGSVSSAFIVSDIALQLNWTNISQRVAFDAMEYIPNYNKSGRALKRLVETNIISGHYDVARKYIDILKNTTFYRKWAQSMRQVTDNPELIKKHPYLYEASKEYVNSADVFFI